MARAFFLLFLSISAFSQSNSKLPLIIINTEGNRILDEPKVMARMKIINNPNNELNAVDDNPEFEGFIGIEYRGSSSQMFPKKPFGIETWDKDGMDIDTSLFGWPSENDWILFASYHEKSLIHNVLTLRMAEQMGLYASRTQYVELYLNGSYEGIYVFMEKVKRDKGRVDIAKLKPDEEEGEDLTGGYIIKIDKSTGSNIDSWYSKYTNLPTVTGFKPTKFFYEYPKSITPIQKDYIRTYVSNFEDALQSDEFADPATGYSRYIDVKSFVTYLLVNEVSKNVDGYRISTFLYKDKNEKLAIGPPWDFDISYGNANYCDGWKYQGFSYRFNKVCPQDGLSVPFWWNRLFQDLNFINAVRDEYEDLRNNGILKDENILALIDELASEIQEPQVRNFQRWKILGTYVWPDFSHPPTWQGEVAELKSWLLNRLEWLDDNLPKRMQLLGQEKDFEFVAKAYPNPFLEMLNLEVHAKEDGIANIQLTDLLGRTIENQNYAVYQGKNQLNIRFPENHSTQTIQLLKIRIGDEQMVQKVVRK